LRAVRVQVDSLDERAFVLVAGVTDDGETLSLEVCQKLFDLPARLVQSGSPDSAAIEAATESALASEVTGAVSALVRQLDSENERFYEAECDKLDRWADDRKAALELRVKELDLAIREADRRKRATRVLSEKIAADQEKSRLTRQRNTARKDLYEAQDKVEQDRERLLESIQARLSSTTRTEHLFTVAWRMDAP
jgi:adenine-specific DNA-methyltransferase